MPHRPLHCKKKYFKLEGKNLHIPPQIKFSNLQNILNF